MVVLAEYSFMLFYLHKFGPIFLFTALILGVVGLPIPDEFLLIGAGYLVAHQKLNMAATVFAAFFGSLCGITISYFLGRLVGKWVVKKYGNVLNITEKKINKVKLWFIKIGRWLLVVGYFIPLFRHLSGFVAGGAKMDYKFFALYAYSGAILWCLTFLSIGYFFDSIGTQLFQK